MFATQGGSRQDVRTLFVSDAHLGSPHAQPLPLLDFLNHFHPQCLYLVGDFIDGWQLKKSFRWQPEYTGLLNRLTEMAESGTEIIYLPGNHDEFLRSDELRQIVTTGLPFARFEDEHIFETVDGRRFLVIHGDRFDVVERSAQWMSKGVTGLYNVMLSLNWWWTRARRRTTVSPYQACAVLKDRVKRVIRFLSSFEDALLQHARSLDCEGVICGHIHSPAIVTRGGMTYCNTGDWVENCTALVEWPDGTLNLRYFYPDDRRQFEQTVVLPPHRSVADYSQKTGEWNGQGIDIAELTTTGTSTCQSQIG